MKIIAIIGPSGGGKSEIALKLALKLNAYIFSIDCISIFKYIDIASAKPSIQELTKVPHFGINVFEPNEEVTVDYVIKLLKQSIKICRYSKKNLIIAGGSSFYLKSFINGLSPMKKPTKEELETFLLKNKLDSNESKFKFLISIDKEYSMKTNPNDSYRIIRGIEIFIANKLPPSEFFKLNPPVKNKEQIEIFNLEIKKDELHSLIEYRTIKMFEKGILKETMELIKNYGRNIKPFNSIGLKECLQHLDGKLNLEETKDLIIRNTKKLAKRQNTFNKTQFKEAISITKNELQKLLAPL